MSRQTIYRGKEDLGQIDAPERVRRPGGGRKKLAEKMPAVLEALEDIVDPTSRGDPESPLRWTCKSVRKIADSLTDQGFAIGRQSVANLLHALDYSLQANRKTSEGKKDHLDRDKTVSVYQSPGGQVLTHILARDFCGYQEKGINRTIQERRA